MSEDQVEPEQPEALESEPTAMVDAIEDSIAPPEEDQRKQQNKHKHQHQNHGLQHNQQKGSKLKSHSQHNKPQSHSRPAPKPYARISGTFQAGQLPPSDKRESWGNNVKGKKFRKEKGKKKRCPNSGVRIDGAVKSFRFN